MDAEIRSLTAILSAHQESTLLAQEGGKTEWDYWDVVSKLGCYLMKDQIALQFPLCDNNII